MLIDNYKKKKRADYLNELSNQKFETIQVGLLERLFEISKEHKERESRLFLPQIPLNLLLNPLKSTRRRI